MRDNIRYYISFVVVFGLNLRRLIFDYSWGGCSDEADRLAFK